MQGHSPGSDSTSVDQELADALRDRYVFGDYCRGVIQTAVLSSGKASNLTDRKLKVDQLSSFGEDARGRVYATSLSGPVLGGRPPNTSLARWS